MKNQKRLFHRTLYLIIFILSLLIISNTIFNNIFYNPYKNEKVNSSTFIILNQILSPSITGTYLNNSYNDKITNVFNFGKYSQSFRMEKFSYLHNPYEPKISGKINYKRGKITIDNYDNVLGLNNITCLQKLFMDTSDITQEIWDKIELEKTYEVWIKFLPSINQATFSDNYAWLLDNSISRPKKSGIMWIPIKTSENDSDICLGMAGNLSFHYLTLPHTISGISGDDYYNLDLYGREILFEQSLKFLTEHPKDAKIFLEYGLWDNAETIDFNERYSYISENGFQYMGFVGYMNGEDLLSFRNDEFLSIVKLLEQ